MKALINPLQDNFVVQVEPANKTFDVATPMYWVDCDINIKAYLFKYINNEFINYEPPVYIPTADENKTTAIELLKNTDWTAADDVGNPLKANPYLANQPDFITYRNSVRQIALNPIAGNLDWPLLPNEIWTTV